MKVTIAFLLVSLWMDICLSQSTGSSPVSSAQTTSTTKNANTTTATNINSSITTNPASISTVTNPANGSTITTTSASRGSNSAYIPPFLAVLSVVGFLLL